MVLTICFNLKGSAIPFLAVVSINLQGNIKIYGLKSSALFSCESGSRTIFGMSFSFL